MTTSTFTPADVQAMAEMMRPHLSDLTPDGLRAAYDAAKAEIDWEMQLQGTRVDLYVDALMGTYNEFRAEAVA